MISDGVNVMKLRCLFNQRLFFVVVYILFLACGFLFCMHFYNNYITKESERIATNNEFDSYIFTYETIDNGFNLLDVKKDLKNYLNEEKRNLIIYKVKNQDFYFEVEIYNGSININKFVDKKNYVNARLNYYNVEKIEFITGNINRSTLYRIITKDGNTYLVVTDGTYYVLGSDIDAIIYKNNQFYYITYNPKYEMLSNVSKCNQSIKDAIDGFDYGDYYYKSGEINFLKNYYQKLKAKNYYVKEYCNYLSKSANNAR